MRCVSILETLHKDLQVFEFNWPVLPFQVVLRRRGGSDCAFRSALVFKAPDHRICTGVVADCWQRLRISTQLSTPTRMGSACSSHVHHNLITNSNGDRESTTSVSFRARKKMLSDNIMNQGPGAEERRLAAAGISLNTNGATNAGGDDHTVLGEVRRRAYDALKLSEQQAENASLRNQVEKLEKQLDKTRAEVMFRQSLRLVALSYIRRLIASCPC